MAGHASMGAAPQGCDIATSAGSGK